MSDLPYKLRNESCSFYDLCAAADELDHLAAENERLNRLIDEQAEANRRLWDQQYDDTIRLTAELAALKVAAWDVHSELRPMLEDADTRSTRTALKLLDELGELLPVARPEGPKPIADGDTDVTVDVFKSMGLPAVTIPAWEQPMRQCHHGYFGDCPKCAEHAL